MFESMSITNGEISLWPFHYDRLRAGMKALRYDFDDSYSSENLYREIKRLKATGKHAKVRLMVYRNNGGLYTPDTSACSFLIEMKHTDKAHYEQNDTGLHLSIYDEIPIQSDYRLANIKSGNALAYVMAALHRKKFNKDECILLNDKGNVTECIASNLFIVEQNKLITPHLKSGCVAGVMRRTVISMTKTLGIEVKERINVTPRDLFEAEGILLTNAVRGINWVEKLDEHLFPKLPILSALNSRLKQFKCPQTS